MRRTSGLLTSAALGVALLAPLSSRADSVTVKAGTLPSARYYTSAVWSGSFAYIFGGFDGATRFDQILRYDPAADVVTTLAARLPSARSGTSAIFDGTDAYIFGGFDGTARLDQIVRFTPSTGAVTTLAAKLPVAASGHSAVWDGTNAYLFGGNTGTTFLGQVIKFTPSTGTVSVASALLPPITNTSAAWIGSFGYVFGGRGPTGNSNAISKFDPATGAVTTMTAKLTMALAYTAAVANSKHAFILGGDDGTSRTSHIQAYDPGADTVTPMSAALPSSICCASAVWVENHAFLFGGKTSGAGNLVVRYDPIPGPPLSPSAIGGAGQISLTWQAPGAGTYVSPINGYKIYRGTAPGAEVFLKLLGDVHSYVDSGLLAGARYYYKIGAVNEEGEGPPSVEVSATVGPAVAPSAPRNLQSSLSLLPLGTHLSWEAPSSNGGAVVTGYRIYRGTSSGGETFLRNSGTQTSYVDSSCALGSICYYTVTAVNGAGESPASNEASFLGTALP